MIYLKLLKMTIMSQLQYKLSMIMATLSHFVITIIEFIGVFYLFQRFPTIKGWTLYEVMVFYGSVHIAFAMAEMGVRAFDNFDKLVREGHFDRYLLRPVNLFVQVMGSEFQLLRLGRMSAGAVALWFGFSHLGITLNLGKIVLLAYAISGAVAMFSALFIFQATASFFTVDALEVFNAFTYGGVEMTQYPMDVYKSWFRNIFLYVIPVGGVTYFSILAILDKPVSVIASYGFPLLGFVVFGIGSAFFKYVGLRHYQSTGA